jgi:hypothetical protein
MTIVLLAAFISFLNFGSGLEQQHPEDQLRLKAGNAWLYRGVVEWTEPSTPEEQARNAPPRFGKKQITWKTEIVEQIDKGELKAYVVNGSFENLPWYEPGKNSSEQYLWIVYEHRFFSLMLTSELMQRLGDPNDSLISAVLNEEPVLKFPLREGQCTVAIEPKEVRERQDLFYCWYLEHKKEADIRVTGLGAIRDVWNAWYRSNPDHQILGFAPGVGFVSYDFSHHGTLSETHIKLVEAHLH